MSYNSAYQRPRNYPARQATTALNQPVAIQPAVDKPNPCPICGEVPTNKENKFCNACGVHFYENCANCSHTNKLMDRYCAKCGVRRLHSEQELYYLYLSYWRPIWAVVVFFLILRILCMALEKPRH